MKNRIECPCCGYPTLEEAAAYEICELCNWEDDGQGDAEADEVWGGPNKGYSLTQARNNFRSYGVMYEPGNDPRITGVDGPKESQLKSALVETFTRYRAAPVSERSQLESEIVRLEAELRAEVALQIKEYERRARG